MLRPSRPMIRPFMSSDGQLDERGRRLGGMAGGDALERVGDEVPGAPLRLRLRLLLHLANPAGEVVADELLGLLEQMALASPAVIPEIRSRCLSSSLLGLLQLLLERAEVRLAVGQTLLAPGELGQLPLDLLLRREHALLDLGDSRPALGQLALDLGAEPDRLLAGLDLRLAANRLGLALGLRRAAARASGARRRPATHPARGADTSTTSAVRRTIPTTLATSTSMRAPGSTPVVHGEAAGAHSAPGPHSRSGSVERGARGPGARLQAVSSNLLLLRFAGARLGVVIVSVVSEPIQKTLAMQAKCRVEQADILAPIRTRLQRASASAASIASSPNPLRASQRAVASDCTACRGELDRALALRLERADRLVASGSRDAGGGQVGVGSARRRSPRAASALARARARNVRRRRRRHASSVVERLARTPRARCRRRGASRGARARERSRWRSARAAASSASPRRSSRRSRRRSGALQLELGREAGAHSDLERDPPPRSRRRARRGRGYPFGRA